MKYAYALNTSHLDRTILISEPSGEKYEMPFPSKEVNDSQALHHLLCLVHPGDEYTVTFSSIN